VSNDPSVDNSSQILQAVIAAVCKLRLLFASLTPREAKTAGRVAMEDILIAGIFRLVSYGSSPCTSHPSDFAKSSLRFFRYTFLQSGTVGILRAFVI